ncbi:hypothetical protein ES708_30678 [subsurface metagenome]
MQSGYLIGSKIIGTDIAFVSGGGGEDTITQVAAKFLENNFVAGDVITVLGSADNDGDYAILSVIAGTINVATESLTAEVAGASVTISSSHDLAATYGVYIQKVKGALDFLKRKGETAHNWLDSTGEEYFTDIGDIHFGPRDIILFCYIKADTKADFLTKLNLFKAVLEGPGLRTLKLPFLDDTLDVYFKDGGVLNMLTGWNSSLLVGKFILKLREPVPSTA